MKWYVFKAPRKKTDKAIKTLEYEPTELILGTMALQYGPIMAVSQEEIDNERKEEQND